MYRCEICQAVVGPNVPLIRHTIYRRATYGRGMLLSARNEIAREIPVCGECDKELQLCPLATVLRERGRKPARHVKRVLFAPTPDHLEPILLGKDIN